jgi:hypothetical protein
MANRNDSDMRQHETLPGPGPGPGRNPALTRSPNARPVEQMVDAAIESFAHEQDAHEREDGEHRADPHARSDSEHALAVPNDPSARERRLSTRLRWKGLDVSDEFRRYAERVARGEDLPPFEGQVLADPNAAFPFGPAAAGGESAQERMQEGPARSGRSSRIALWTSAAAVLGLIGWTLSQRVDADESSAVLNAVPAASPATGIATSSATSPHDVVETPAPPEAQAAVVNQEPAMTEGAPSAAAPSDPSQPVDVSLHPAVAGASIADVAAGSSAPVVAAVPAPAAAAAPPRASLEQTVSAAPRPAVLGAPLAAAGVARENGLPEEDFGILPAGDGAPISTPANTALPAAKSVAHVNGNVGDLARSGQVPVGPARKEPGSESSAKGSLLVETPSF